MTAFHRKDEDGKHIIGIGSLRVMLVRDGKFWLAQGMEIDYAAQGLTIQDAKKQFEAGLAATIEEHVKIHENIDLMLNPVPAELWNELTNNWKSAREFYYSQLYPAFASSKPLTADSVHGDNQL